MLSDTFVEAARFERRRLFADLNKSPEFQQWWALRKLLFAYDQQREDDEEGLGEVRPPRFQRPSGQPAYENAQRASRPGSRASQVADAAAKWFASHGQRAQSLEIMKALQREGFEFSGAKPTAALASILSHSDLFDNVRGEGYGLRVWSGGDTEVSVDRRADGTPEARTETATPIPGSPFE